MEGEPEPEEVQDFFCLLCTEGEICGYKTLHLRERMRALREMVVVALDRMAY